MLSRVPKDMLDHPLARTAPNALRVSQRIRECRDPDTLAELLSLYQMFRKADANRDGFLEPRQLSELLRTAGMPRDMDEVKSAITWYLTKQYGTRGAARKALMIDLDSVIDMLALESFRDMFKEMDSKGRGALSPSDFAAGMQRMGISADVCAMLFRLADANGDGALSFMEFSSMFSRMGETKHAADEPPSPLAEQPSTGALAPVVLSDAATAGKLPPRMHTAPAAKTAPFARAASAGPLSQGSPAPASSSPAASATASTARRMDRSASTTPRPSTTGVAQPKEQATPRTHVASATQPVSLGKSTAPLGRSTSGSALVPKGTSRPGTSPSSPVRSTKPT